MLNAVFFFMLNLYFENFAYSCYDAKAIKAFFFFLRFSGPQWAQLFLHTSGLIQQQCQSLNRIIDGPMIY